MFLCLYGKMFCEGWGGEIRGTLQLLMDSYVVRRSFLCVCTREPPPPPHDPLLPVWFP